MPDLVTKTEFRNAMARVCAPVNIITTDGPAGRGGFTATAMCSVSDEPPTLLVCMNGRSAQCDLFLANKRFCVNVLTHEHMHLAGKFAGGTQDMTERYAAAQWLKMASGTPALADAIVNFDCEIEMVHHVGTHNVMIGRVTGVRHRPDGNALLYVDRTYVHVPTQLGSFGG
ncbi:flavin reductase [Paradevosia shaoguanensis]|uniref:Flavin reductase n=1 Tax=Paradevosia shaoguanensis TaxID=1335043 RepID=A0AA41QK60_9HYPH|nr:flavin reductase [Paradevosia shaoguanensis]MCF1741937.1 flavin reductase [Paradevosia shaoguanensis]MCI0126420.1 flavin reductase [Paradevosia shaoguanensis]